MATSSPSTDAPSDHAEHYAHTLVFYVNKQRFEIENPNPQTLLVEFLRSTEVGLTGTKHSCGQGGCGACTVTLSHYDEKTKKVVNLAGNSCLHPLCALDGMQVTTVEGIGNVETGVSPVQYEIAKCNGSQCGYCTPGFVMNMHSFLLEKKGCDLSAKEIEGAFDGNICRCTGFRPILYGMKKFATDGGDEKEENGTPPCLVDPAMAVTLNEKPSPVFPIELERSPRRVAYRHRDHFQKEHLWFRPLCLDEVHELMHKYRDREVKLVVGNTTVGIPGVNPLHPDVHIDISYIAELHDVCSESDHLTVGAAVTYTEFLGILEDQLKNASEEQKAGLEAIHYMAHRTAGTIVRNVASLAGNTMLVVRNATSGTPFPSDVFTALLSMDAQIEVQTKADDSLKMGLLEFVDRYNDEKDLSFREEAVILRYHIPYTTAGEYITTYKVALREVNSHSLVNAGLRVKINADKIIESATLVFGAITPVAFHADNTEAFLTGKPWNREAYEVALEKLTGEIMQKQGALPEWFRELPYDGISDAYRLHLAKSYFHKFFVEVSGKIAPDLIPAPDRSAGVRYERPVSWGSQTYEAPSEGDTVGQPFIKLSAFEQATGEAKYTHDIPVPVRGLHGSLVTSTVANTNPDPSFWYQLPDSSAKLSCAELIDHLRDHFGKDFVDYITWRDIPDGGSTGVNVGNSPRDPWFCKEISKDSEMEGVTCYGQSIGLVVAESESLANTISAYVREECIAYNAVDEENIVLDILTPRSRNTFFPNYDTDDNHLLETSGYQENKAWVGRTGPVDVNDEQGNSIRCEAVTGTQNTGYQIHFYMETQATVAIPGEGPEITVHSSTQSPDSIQGDVKDALNIQANQVEVDIKRLGGGYGGKTTRTPFIAVPAALAASKLRRPVRVALQRETDSWTIGDRHPFAGDYSMAIASEGDMKGKIMGSSTMFYSNGGNTRDCSWDVMDCAQLGADNAYNVPYFFTRGDVCETNTHSQNAMRSYGGIQAMLIQEDALEAAANSIGVSPETVREMNFYENGDKTPFGQELKYCYIKDVWDRLKKTSDFEQRLEEVKKFNVENRWRKRGISMIPLKYGMGFNLGFLMQGGAHVDLYTADGTVLVQVGGVEMGQGIFTKVAQVAAHALNVPLGLVRLGSTQTSVVPDPMSTGATSGTDLCGGAVKAACRELRKRLEANSESLRETMGDLWCRASAH
jgi:xanthine dehydrogenase/oxidase